MSTAYELISIPIRTAESISFSEASITLVFCTSSCVRTAAGSVAAAVFFVRWSDSNARCSTSFCLPTAIASRWAVREGAPRSSFYNRLLFSCPFCR